VAEALAADGPFARAGEVQVFPIDPALADTVAATGMEYGGITPIGLPPDWALWVDAAVAATPEVIIGSGVRRSKLVLPGAALAQLPGAEVVEGLAR
jgi:prolyl-tRNA editing enzyme YbaK/EbsC (Cys-tRNA(Pro) deacylase)